ncbi:hypothetical protein F4805DRAFT_478395 [Annulohypoxylon moriforme]|nr:hypothetical protein F4805DRAFT_478395 [Annulohypoxylon moriforme]
MSEPSSYRNEEQAARQPTASSFSEAAGQTRRARSAAPTTMRPDQINPMTNGVGHATRDQRTTRTQGAAPQDAPAGPRGSRPRTRRSHRSARGHRNAPLSPLAPAFVPLSVPVTQAGQTSQANGYPAGLLPYPFPGTYPTSTPPPFTYPYGPHQAFNLQRQGQGPAPYFSSYQAPNGRPGPYPVRGSYGRVVQPPPGFGGPPVGPPPPAPRPAHAQLVQPQFSSQGQQQSVPRASQHLTEEERREIRINLYRRRHEQGRGFDEDDDDEFIPNV